ncbi:MAG: CHAT domain-containing protein, partial [Cyanobacteria bacterium J06649_11]
MQEDQAYLYYHVSDSIRLVFRIQKDLIEFRVLDKSFPLGIAINQFKDQLLLPQKSLLAAHAPENRTSYAKNALALYEFLFPFEKPLPQYITIIPDGELSTIPFDALITKDVPLQTPFGDLPYAMHSHTFSHAYSLEGLWRMREKRVSAVQDIGIFTPAFYQDSTWSARHGLPVLGILKNIKAEADTLNTIWPSAMTYAGAYASKERFQKVAGKYKVLHISTHGVSSSDNDYSFLGLSSITGEPYDRLYYNEISTLKLNADLVYLSACETGVGTFYSGEGVFSLARAFASAGSKSIVMTSWSVDEKATLDITIQFYKNIKLGMAKHAALKQAKQHYIK